MVALSHDLKWGATPTFVLPKVMPANVHGAVDTFARSHCGHGAGIGISFADATDRRNVIAQRLAMQIAL